MLSKALPPGVDLRLVNHASIMVSTPNAIIVSDPWIEGSAFNDGWDLLVPGGMPDLTSDTRPVFVWYSHEHPDHFSPRWLKGLSTEVKSRTTVLFQQTIDHRVAAFCRANGFPTIEMTDGQSYHLAEDLDVTCGFVWEYDSWLLVKAPGLSFLNLNDCRVPDDDLAALAAKVGSIDVLATQFSYAAWKGGPDQTALRRQYAGEKLRHIQAQIQAISPTWVLPFASFIYFSHEENRYMNDAINSIDDAEATISTTPAKPMVLFPGDSWTPGTAHDPTPAMAQWRHAFQMESRTFRTSKPIDRDTLVEAAGTYRRTLGKVNNRLFLALIRAMPVGGFLRPLTIELYDQPGRNLRFSAWKGLTASSDPADVKLHSSSLEFILTKGFGFDSLLVNGRFEADTDGFRKLSRMFGITVINNTGRSIGWRGLKDVRYFASLLSTVRKFSDNAERAEAAATTPAGGSPSVASDRLASSATA